MKKLGAVATLTVDIDTVIIRLEVLISALQVHGYTYGNLSIIDPSANL